MERRSYSSDSSLRVLATGAGALLLAGLWTPVAGTLVAGIEVWKVFLHPADPWICILLGTLGAALAMLGPGAWSVDARLFGWKRIHLPARKELVLTPLWRLRSSSREVARCLHVVDMRLDVGLSADENGFSTAVLKNVGSNKRAPFLGQERPR